MRQIIIQDRINIPSDFSFRYVFWLAVPAARQTFYANPAATSVVKDATTAELQAIQNGAVIEEQYTDNYAAGTLIAAIQASLIAKYNARQTVINNTNPWQYYGSSWDGTSWTVKTTS